MIKAVFDTNIFVSSIFWEKGNPHRAVEFALEKKVGVFTSVEILQELERVLRRDFEEPDEMIQRQIGLIVEYSDIVAVNRKVDAVKSDPEDNKILACAVSCDADYIVSGDRHLLELKEYESVKIVTAKQFVDIVEKSTKN
ncbi:MAG TPA: putative toxin-antitoxin system toxin component, PIN family [Candidatus Aenigmarchaeota archaeon]|nr:putative toxin-antitoxin system toxin component, PIN family [Candidatus Aenigmarchaeota archaeon]